ncbi:MAG: hypothetical protein HQL45_00710 [Alphaproteobacteria bacterium]|nr:hypothetical protein [Alphaproteobacteria bacterium]
MNQSDLLSLSNRGIHKFGEIFQNHSFLIIFVFSLVATVEYFALGQFSYLNPEAEGDSSIPSRILLGMEMARGQVGQWENHFAGGMDRLSALFQINLLAPLFAFLPAWTIVGGVIFTSTLIGIWSVCAILRTYLAIAPPLATVAGIFYALGVQEGLLYYFNAFEFCLMPLSLYALHRFRERPLVAALCQFLIAASLGWGYSLHAVYVLLLVAPWSLFVVGWSRRTALFVVAAHIAGWLCYLVPISAPVLSAVATSGVTDVAGNLLDIPFIELMKQQVTSGVYFLFVIPPIPFLVPALLALWLGGLSPRQRIVLQIGFLLAALLYFAPLISWIQHAVGVPLDSLRLRRMSNAVALAALLAVAVGAQALGERLAIVLQDRKEPFFRLGFRGLTFSVFLFICLVGLFNSKIFHLERYRYGATYSVLYENPLIRSTFAAIGTAQPFRVASVVPKPFHTMAEPDHAWAYGLETSDGYFAFHTREYAQFWEAMYQFAPQPLPVPDEIRGFTQGRRFYVQSVSEKCEASLLGAHVNLRFLSALNTQYLISPCPLLDKEFTLLARTDPSLRLRWDGLGRFEKLKAFLAGGYPGKELYIYRFDDAVPRIFMAERVLPFEGPEALLNDIAYGAGSHKVARLLPGSIAKSQECPKAQGSVRLVQYDPDEIRVHAELSDCGLLVIANNYHVGWIAEVDGRPAELLRVNLLHQGLFLPPGKHQVRLRYFSPYMPGPG